MVLQATQVFGWLDILLNRLGTGVNEGTVALTRPPGSERTQGWRDILQYALVALDGLRKDGLLGGEVIYERAYALLGRMAAAPFDLNEARHVMSTFQNMQT